jgi:hypothetical protein
MCIASFSFYGLNTGVTCLFQICNEINGILISSVKIWLIFHNGCFFKCGWGNRCNLWIEELRKPKGYVSFDTFCSQMSVYPCTAAVALTGHFSYTWSAVSVSAYNAKCSVTQEWGSSAPNMSGYISISFGEKLYQYLHAVESYIIQVVIFPNIFVTRWLITIFTAHN